MREGSVSRPAWARGLKPVDSAALLDDASSRPAWARGLKLLSALYERLRVRRAPRGRVD